MSNKSSDVKLDVRLGIFRLVPKLAQNNPKWAFALIGQAVDDKDCKIRQFAVYAAGQLAQNHSEWAIPLLEQAFCHKSYCVVKIYNNKTDHKSYSVFDIQEGKHGFKIEDDLSFDSIQTSCVRTCSKSF